MNTELKPCPFCGGEAVYEPEGFTVCGYWVKCSICGAERHIYSETREEAAEIWNTRADIQADGNHRNKEGDNDVHTSKQR